MNNDLQTSMFQVILDKSASPTDRFILPKTFGLHKFKEQSTQREDLNLNSYHINNGYLKMVQQAFKHEDLKNVEKLKLSNTNLTDRSLCNLSEILPKNLTHLDISKNNISYGSSKALQNLISPRM